MSGKLYQNESTVLRRSEQVTVAILVLAALIAVAIWYGIQGGFAGQLVELQRAKAQQARFLVDINTAQWPELAQLPEVGETIARRIVESRETGGPFPDHDSLLRVSGVGPRTLERIRPYLAPIDRP